MSAIVQIRSCEPTSLHSTLLTAVMESLVDGLAIAENGHILRANSAFANAFGYRDGEEIEGCALVNLIPNYVSLLATLDLGRTEGRGNPAVQEYLGKRKDGSYVQISMALAAMRRPHREAVILNIPGSELQAGDKHWLDSRKMEAMGRMAGSVAHDFNNLLTGILLYCDLLLARLEENSPLRTYVEEIRKAGGQSAGLIQQMLTLARPQKELASLISWNEILSSMWEFLQRILGETIVLIANLDDAAGSVRMEPARMRQIVLNLLLNARDAMAGGGRIVIAVRNSAQEQTASGASCVELTVTDSGSGMDAETLTHLFEPFFSTKPQEKGMGIGLATVQRIVWEAGGTIHVESEPGKGTSFSVLLPSAQHQSGTREILEDNSREIKSEGRHI